MKKRNTVSDDTDDLVTTSYRSPRKLQQRIAAIKKKTGIAKEMLHRELLLRSLPILEKEHGIAA